MKINLSSFITFEIKWADDSLKNDFDEADISGLSNKELKHYSLIASSNSLNDFEKECSSMLYRMA